MTELDYYGIPVGERRESPELRLLRAQEAFDATLQGVQAEMIDDLTSIAAAIITDVVPFAREHITPAVYVFRRTNGVVIVSDRARFSLSPVSNTSGVEISTSAWERTVLANPSRTGSMLQRLLDRMTTVSDTRPRTVSVHADDDLALCVTVELTPALDAHYAEFLAALGKIR